MTDDRRDTARYPVRLFVKLLNERVGSSGDR